MSAPVCVFGLWHLGCVTAACLAEQGFDVIGLDLDPERVVGLTNGQVPVAEPGLSALISEGLAKRKLTFSSEPTSVVPTADVLWISFDTPVDADDQADLEWVRRQLDCVQSSLTAGTLVVISAQVPVGFARALEREWRGNNPTLEFASVPENLRLGQALESYRNPSRVVVGLGERTARARVERLLPTGAQIEWMSLESAEMTKHALNGFLFLSAAYANELARVAERVGADATEVERGLRSEPRVGPRAYISPGAPIGGGTLARDVTFLTHLGTAAGLDVPLLTGILESNRVHARWVGERIQELLEGIHDPQVALLGLTYKPGTDTLRRSTAVELGRSLTDTGASVRAYDPAIASLPRELDWLQLAASGDAALAGADVAVLATPWPEFQAMQADLLVRAMRRPQLVDQTGFLRHIGADPRVRYVRVGQPEGVSQNKT
jgi:UDPglucose 6-dehydrogenase